MNWGVGGRSAPCTPPLYVVIQGLAVSGKQGGHARVLMLAPERRRGEPGLNGPVRLPKP